MSNYNVNLTDITDTRQVNVNVTTGDKGWSAELVMVRRESDGALVALREWIGGSGEKPTPPQYVAEDGFTDNIEEAVNFQGDKGDKPNHEWIGYSLRFELPNGDWGTATDLRGEQGEKGVQGEQGFTPYIGSNGNWWIDDQDLGFSPDAYIAINSTSLPTPVTSNNFSLVTEGAYTRAGQSNVVVPAGKLGIITWDGSAWSLASAVDLPTQPVTGIVEEGNTQAVSGGEVFSKLPDLSGFVEKASIVDDLISTNPLDVLSANQGRVLRTNINHLSTLKYSLRGSNIEFDPVNKTITSTGTLTVRNGSLTGVSTQRLLTIAGGTFDFLSFQLANATADVLFIYTTVTEAWVNGAGITPTVPMENLEITALASDVRDVTKVVLFTYDRFRNTISSPFFDELIYDLWKNSNVLNPEAVKTQLKLQFSSAGTFGYDKNAGMLSWTGSLYIFNRAGTSTGARIRIGSGSYDIKTAISLNPNPTRQYWVVYIMASDAYINGTTNGEAVFTTSDFILKEYAEAPSINEARSMNAIILFYYDSVKGEISSPWFEGLAQTAALTSSGSGGSGSGAYLNVYPNIYAKLPLTTQKYNSPVGATVEDSVNIVWLGDSIWARQQYTTLGDVNPSTFPPILVTNTIASRVFKRLPNSIPDYRRYDAAGVFTENGVFTSSFNDPNWDDGATRPAWTRFTVTPNASVSFVAPSANDFFNLIDRTDTAGAGAVTVAVSTGAGTVEARVGYSGEWVEADGFTFSQISQSGAGYGNTNYQRRIMFRKVGTGLGSDITVTLSKGNNSDRLLYWGLELYKGNKPHTTFINSARGSHRLDQLASKIETDVYDKNPTLIFLEIPLLNITSNNQTKEYAVNQVHDFIWGDRVGFENPNALKARSNGWQDFEVILIIPHHANNQFNPDGTFIVESTGITKQEIYSAVKSFIYNRGDVAMIDMASAMLREIDADPEFMGQYYNATIAGSTTYMSDGTHPNDKGAETYNKYLSPIFDFNTL